MEAALTPPDRVTRKKGAGIFLSPAVIILLIWSLIPLVLTLWYSFQNYNLVDPTLKGFAGVSNYVYLLTDPDFCTPFSIPFFLCSAFWSSALGAACFWPCSTIRSSGVGALPGFW